MRSTVVRSALCLTLFLLPWALLADAKPDGRVKAMLEKVGLEYTTDEDGDFLVEFEQPGGRTQFAKVLSDTETYDGIEIREIYSDAGAFEEEPDLYTLLDLMTESGNNKLACWAFDEDDGRYYLYYTIKLPVSHTANDLEKMMDFAAMVADEREDQFFGTDDF